jgi:steroid 5-alpha reductase family enzyme
MKEIIKRLIAITTVLFLSLLLNKATTLELQGTVMADLGLHILVIIFTIQLVVFLISFVLKTEHFYDLTGGITYITLVLFALYQQQLNEVLNLRSIILATLILIWAARLSSFLFMRIKKAGKDRRFDQIKTSFTRFMLAWTLQGFWVFMCTLPAVTAFASESKPLDVFLILGALLWVFGFFIEVTADRQKSAFNQDPKNHGKFISTGLWSLSRHPNYVGEVLLWTGISLISFPILEGYQYMVLLSPLFTYLLLTRVSGVNLLEANADKKWGATEAYQKYKENTPIFFPFKN